METVSKYDFIRIGDDATIIHTFQGKCGISPSFHMYEDVTITKKENGTLEIEGKLIVWNFLVEYQNYIEDLPFEHEQTHVKQGYKSFWDIFKGKTKPYLPMGWHILKERRPEKMLMNKWVLIHH